MGKIGSIFAEQEMRRESLGEQAKREFAAVVAELQEQYKAERIRVAEMQAEIDRLHDERIDADRYYMRLSDHCQYWRDRYKAVRDLCEQNGISITESYNSKEVKG